MTVCRTSEGTSLCMETGVGYGGEIAVQSAGKLARSGIELGWQLQLGPLSGGLKVATGDDGCGVTGAYNFGVSSNSLRIENDNGRLEADIMTKSRIEIGTRGVGFQQGLSKSPVQGKSYGKICRRW